MPESGEAPFTHRLKVVLGSSHITCVWERDVHAATELSCGEGFGEIFKKVVLSFGDEDAVTYFDSEQVVSHPGALHCP